MVEVVRGVRVGTRIWTPHGTISNGHAKLTPEQRGSLREQGYVIDRLASLPVEPPPFDEIEQREAAARELGFAFVSTGDQIGGIADIAKRALEEAMQPIESWKLLRRLFKR